MKQTDFPRFRFREENSKRLEQNQRCLFVSNAAMQWLDIRLQLIGVAVVTGLGVIAVIQQQYGVVDPGEKVKQRLSPSRCAIQNGTVCDGPCRSAQVCWVCPCLTLCPSHNCCLGSYSASHRLKCRWLVWSEQRNTQPNCQLSLRSSMFR